MDIVRVSKQFMELRLGIASEKDPLPASTSGDGSTQCNNMALSVLLAHQLILRDEISSRPQIT